MKLSELEEVHLLNTVDSVTMLTGMENEQTSGKLVTSK